MVSQYLPWIFSIVSAFTLLFGQPTQAARQFHLPYSQNLTRVLQQAKSLGAPMKAVERALDEAGSGKYPIRDVLAVFDLSQNSKKKRFYLLDLRAGTTTAYHSSHGRGNGDNLHATHFRGFEDSNSNMTPLGPLRTAPAARVIEEYETVVDPLTARTYNGLVILDLYGTAAYNSRFNPSDIWAIMHSKWYVTEGFRKKYNGMLGRSLGCIVLDPVYSNRVFKRLEGGALLYVTVGNQPVEAFL